MESDFTCSKCHSADIPRYTRKKLRRNGKRTVSRASYCIACHKEDQKIIEERRYDKKLAYNRDWRKRNRKKVNKYSRKYYHLNKDRINLNRRINYKVNLSSF